MKDKTTRPLGFSYRKMKAKKVKKKTRPRVMWSFEPDDDVRKLVDDYLAKHPETDRTRFLQQAIKLKFPQLFLESAKKDLQSAQTFVADLERTSADKH